MKQQVVSFFTLFSLLLIASPQMANAELSLGGFGGWSSLVDNNSSVPSVKATTLGAYVVPSVSVLPILSLGAYGEYHSVSQRTKPAEASNNDRAFTGYLVGGAMVIDAAVFRLTGAYTFHGEGKVKNKNSSGLSETLVDPKGMHAILGVSLMPFLSLDIGYTRVKFSVRENGAATSRKRDWKDYRAGLSLTF